MRDLAIQDHHSVVLVYPISPAGAAWVKEYIPHDAIWFGNGVAIDQAYLELVLDSVFDEGLAIEGVKPFHPS